MSISALAQPSPYNGGTFVATLTPSAGFPASNIRAIYTQVGNVVWVNYSGTVTINAGVNTATLTLPIPRQTPFVATGQVANTIDIYAADNSNYFNPDVLAVLASSNTVTLTGTFGGGAPFAGLFTAILAYTLA